MDFITAHLPDPPARVLDAGCGSGELARKLHNAGYDVTAIDIDPTLASPTVQTADLCTYQDEPFDAVILSLSLHHVHDLEQAIDRTVRLLKPGAPLIVDEFAYERADAAIADRFYGAPGSLQRWREHHQDYNTGRAMIAAIARRFAITSVAEVPYLYRYLEDDSLYGSESVLGFQLIAVPTETALAAAVFALTTDTTAEDAEPVDER